MKATTPTSPAGRWARSLSAPAAPGASARAAPRSLSALDTWQSPSLADLRDPTGPHAAMLSTLIVTNCLLELAKLGTMRLATSDFVQSAVSVLAQYTPVERCAISVSASGLPGTRVESGDWSHPRDDTITEAIGEGTGSEISGWVEVGGLPDLLRDAGLVVRVAEQITQVLPAVIEAERARREAAASRILDLVSALTETYAEESMRDIVEAFQMLPGAVGASICLEVPRFGAPVIVRAGLCAPELPTTTASEELDHPSRITTTLFWAGDAEDGPARAESLHERLVLVLRRIEQAIRLTDEAEKDELTGIGNRRLASRVLAQTTMRAARNNEEFAVLLFDLDWFKSVNDSYGHDVGDRVLQAFATMLKSGLRGYDIPVRWGGEEFLVVCPATELDAASALARQLMEATPSACAEVLADHTQTVSVGIAAFPHSADNPNALVRAADMALRTAKQTGRNRFVVAPAAPRARISAS